MVGNKERRQRREASLDDLFRTRGDQQPPEEVLDELQEGFLKAIDRVKANYSDEDVISAVEASWDKSQNQTKAKDDKLASTLPFLPTRKRWTASTSQSLRSPTALWSLRVRMTP